MGERRRLWALIRMELVKAHHKQEEACENRPRYRQGRFEKAVKVYTVNQESCYLLVQNVPALGVVKELVDLFSVYGDIDEYRLLDEYPSEPYTDVYWLKFVRIGSARVAKKKLDNRSFFGRQLHVCYAPEYETVQDTRAKLQQRRIAIASKTRDTCSLSKEDSTNVSEMTVRQEAEPLAHVHDTQERTTKTVAETQTGAGLMQDCSVTVIPGFPPLPDLPCPYNPQQGFVGGGLLPLPNPYLPPPNTSSYDSEVTCSSNSSKVHNTAHQRRVEYETSTKGNSVQKKPSSGLNKEERISLHLEMVGDGVSSTQFSMHQHHTPATSTSTATPPHPVRSDSHRTKPMTVGKKRPLVTETDAKQPSKVPSRVPSLEISTGSTSVDQTVQSVRQKMMKVWVEPSLNIPSPSPKQKKRKRI